MSNSQEKTSVNTRNIEFEDLIREEKSNLDVSVLESYDFIPISTMLTADDIWMIKKVKSQGKRVYVNKGPPYVELRGGEWELALYVIGEATRDIVIGLVGAWIYDKLRAWNEAKKSNPGSRVKQPGVKLKFYLKKSKKHIVIEGEADDVLKALDKIKEE